MTPPLLETVAGYLSNILGKPIRKRTADSVTFADGNTEKQHFTSLIKPYLWWGE